jgi:hypothetical protein
VLQLINHKRPVTVVWHRGQGPAFVAALARAVRVEEYEFPDSIGGVSRGELLTNLKAVLLEHGSAQLKRDIARHGTDLYEALTQESNVEAITLRLQSQGYLDSVPFELSAAR